MCPWYIFPADNKPLGDKHSDNDYWSIFYCYYYFILMITNLIFQNT